MDNTIGKEDWTKWTWTEWLRQLKEAGIDATEYHQEVKEMDTDEIRKSLDNLDGLILSIDDRIDHVILTHELSQREAI
tara:strand:- start:213 stop:446 length:234 start_codon:yes stop_codon:yes gene_type:complete